MKSNIFIPKTINVGYQNRSDTYTGKLAYIIYYDEKGKLRKEVSWNGWRDKNIPNEEFDNVPTEGFVLNKKVGDCSSGWDHRQAYCRVYDPRNFEFEITIENLLYILENANSIKGKGLEGEFVYGWDGKDLILMPIESPDYKQITEYNELVHSKENIRAKNLIVGATYLTKNNEERIYMGKFNYYSYGYRWLEKGEYKASKNPNDIPRTDEKRYSSMIPYDDIDFLYGKYFWFAYRQRSSKRVNGDLVRCYEWRFEQFKTISAGKFITCVDDKCTKDYSDIYESMTGTYNFSPRDFDNAKYIPYTFEEFKEYAEKLEDRYNNGNLRRENIQYFSDGYSKYEISYNEETNLWTVSKPYYISDNREDIYDRFAFKVKEVPGFWGKSSEKEIVPITIEELYERLKPCYKEIYLQNGKLYERECYYGN